MTRYMRSLDRGFETYDQLWQWSVDDLEGFWGSLWDWFDIKASKPYDRVLGNREMPGARVVPGRRAQLRRARVPGRPPGRAGDRPRDRGRNGGRRSPGTSCTTRSPAARPGLRRLGVERGDRVAAYLPNVPETVIAFLATREHRRDLVELRARVRRAHGDRPLRADRAQGAARDRGLPLRRQGLRPLRRRWRSWSAAIGSLEHTRARARAGGTTCSPSPPSSSSSRCPSTTRCGSSTRRAPPGCRRRSCRARAGS